MDVRAMGLRVFLMGAASWGAAAPPAGTNAVERLERVRRELRPLELDATSSDSEWIRWYWRFYGLEMPGAAQSVGTRTVGGRTVAVQVFRPEPCRGTVVLVHGYYDHVGVMAHLIRHLVKDGYAVVAYDQPGHGLSAGERATIDDFAEYVEVLGALAGFCQQHLPAPLFCVAHSMGCAVAADYVLTRPAHGLRGAVWLAPLFRSAHWHASRCGRRVAGLWVRDVPRVFRRNSSDEEFLRFTKADPLQPRTVPLRWVDALVAWNRRFDLYPPAGPAAPAICAIQGDGDTTVDWRYGQEILRRKFPRSHTFVVPGAGHQLMNESPEMRSQVFRITSEWLAGPAR